MAADAIVDRLTKRKNTRSALIVEPDQLSGGEVFQVVPNFITYSTEDVQALLLGTLNASRVFKRLVNAFCVARKHGTAFIGIVADGQRRNRRSAPQIPPHALTGEQKYQCQALSSP